MSENAKCQALDCKSDACWETHASNERRPDIGGTQVCDKHLVEPGLCTRSDLPDPDSWTVVPIHEGSPPLCAVSCPTCHPKIDDIDDAIRDARQAIHCLSLEVASSVQQEISKRVERIIALLK